ncbi:MAG: hypothetical protein DWH79_08490 [Planctomycetota bacterium]|nr:MAG: hypothetical protein DWH79_08490 [Planctomycetota bacterium]
MQTFLAKCCVLAVIAAGFACTGDAARLFSHGRRLLEATTVPQMSQFGDAAPAAAAAAAADSPQAFEIPQTFHPDASPLSAAPTPASPATEPTEQNPPSPPHQAPADAPIGTPIITVLPPANGPATLLLENLLPGERLVVWIGVRDGRRASKPTTIAFDIVDGATGEAIEQRHASGDGLSTAHAPGRRVRIVGTVTASGFSLSKPQAAAGQVVRGGLLQIAPIDTLSGTPGPAEAVGQIQAMTVLRPGGL